MKDKDRFVKGGYLLWVVIHMTLAMVNSENFWYWEEDDFYPFLWGFPDSFGDVWAYNISEFLFYTIVPVLVYKAIVLLRPQPEPEPKEDE